MKKTQYSKLKLGAAPLVLSVALVSAPAYAQDATDEAAAQSEIVVTGSLIRNPNLEQSTPVNVTTADTIELKQSNVAEEVLRELPGVVPNIGSAVNNGNSGGSYVDLRGLGATRNIVLLNGNRVAPSDVSGRVDLNNIPLALIERVDASTGAAVTTYGADAITGVVNFVTKRDFAGLEIAASNQITEQGDGNVFRVDATIGANFDDGRGNAVLSIGYQSADAVYQGARRFSADTLDSYSNEFVGSGTGVPSRISGTRPLNPDGSVNVDPATPNGPVRQINAAGAAVGTFATYNFNPFNVFQTPFERYNIYAQANYEVSDAVEVYTRGMFSKNKVSTIIAPSGSFGGAVPINLNNPFLSATLRNQICAFDVDPRAGFYQRRFSQTECDTAAVSAFGTGGYRQTGAGGVFVPADVNEDGVTDPGEGFNTNPGVTLNRRTPEVGPRISDYQTTFFDYRVGVRGGITDTLDWSVEGAYGESENIQTIQGYTLQSRFRQGALVEGTLANPVCQDTSNGCVPVNIFGPEGSITPAAAGFLQENSSTTNRTSLAQVRAIISGDLGFASPGAVQPIGFALGGEYRSYKAQQASDLLAKTPGELGGAGGAAPDINGGYNVYEAYAEVVAPLIEDKPFFESLTLEAGARYSDYSIKGAGGYDTWTWKAGGSWSPGAGVKIRGNYSRAVRAPNIGELFTPLSVGLTNLGIDPCAGTAPTLVANANLRAICIAQGAPVGTIGAIENPTAAQANINAGGNLALQPEKADTWTIGAVFQPDFLPRFNLSIDYYNIKINNVIGAPLPGDIIAACFGNITATSAASAACTSIRRNPLTGGLDGDAATTPGLFGQTNNNGRLFTDGIDLLMNWNTDLGFASLNWSFVGNWTRSSQFKSDVNLASSLNRECVGYYSVNCSFTGSIQPEYQFSNRFTLGFDKVDVSLLWRWQDSVRFEPAQLASDIQSAIDAGTSPTTGCPDPTGTDPNGCVVDPQFRKIKAANYFDLTGRFNVSDNLTVTLTVQNLLDRKPPIVGNTIGSTTFNSGNTFPSTYDALGRRYAIAAKLKF
ncbi:MAG: TonB-dependent receptor [Sphingopyxis sp.]|nr:TonB-dependent receptor [Sphingopyxis sp.]